MTILFIALLGLVLIGVWKYQPKPNVKKVHGKSKGSKVTASNKPIKLSKATGSK